MAKNAAQTDDDQTPPSEAADLIRHKLDRIYEDAPDATSELAEIEHGARRSKHQRFMQQLGASGKDLATIQTEWHQYYQKLPDKEKHAVWKEFYASQALVTQPRSAESPQTLAEHKHQATDTTRAKNKKIREARSKDELQTAIRDKVSAGGKLEAKHHVQSLLFGLGMGTLVIIIFLFGFFNEVLIAPLIQPSRAAAATPLIVSSDSVAPTSTPEVIIPKINVEIPVNYHETSTDESTIENDLQDGVVHYPTTVQPGQDGNAAFFGHSSNNIFNKGKYKFAFVLLHTLVVGDTFYLTNNGKVYVYQVISRTIVPPSDVGVLGPVAGQTATATLITCDPPGTSINRLIVVGKQISPDPAGNTAGTTATSSTDTTLPGNGPTAFTRLMRTTAGKGLAIAILVIGFAWIIRWINAPLRRARIV